MKRKMMIAGLTLILGSMLMTGCSSTGTKQVAEATPVVNEQEKGQDSAEPAEKVNLQVFIAASLKNAMTTISENYKTLHPEVEIVFNADSSGTLQTQIEEGGNCDIFFSAAMKQMNALDEEGYVQPDSIEKVLENKVVLIKPVGTTTKVTGFENITEASNLALAGEDVPVGAYAREIFTNLGILDDVMAMEINEGANVTAVLAAVGEQSNEVGVVYATDAYSVKDQVEIIAEAPAGALKSPVIYPTGLIKNEEATKESTDAAKAFLQYLTTDEALAVFKEYGFTGYTQ